MKPERILVPLDGSLLAEGAIQTAAGLARESGAALVLLRAAEAHTLPGADPTDAQVAVVREAEEYLTAVAARLGEEGVKKVETSVWYGPPATAIIEAARLQKGDLIVMTSHGRSGLGRLILGSVAESVLRGTTTPILLLRAPEAPLEAPKGAGQARPSREGSRV
ncbi:MAG: universal stress protein [Candidatus Rokubacteria bacterium]|nr:universal stress protein [Candidatus Rokubacteria bacterium]